MTSFTWWLFSTLQTTQSTSLARSVSSGARCSSQVSSPWWSSSLDSAATPPCPLARLDYSWSFSRARRRRYARRTRSARRCARSGTRRATPTAASLPRPRSGGRSFCRSARSTRPVRSKFSLSAPRPQPLCASPWPRVTGGVPAAADRDRRLDARVLVCATARGRARAAVGRRSRAVRLAARVRAHANAGRDGRRALGGVVGLAHRAG